MLGGIAMICIEIIVPGGILGIIGGLMLVGSVGVAFADYGLGGALITLMLAMILTGIALAVEFQILPKTRFGKHLFLNSESGGRLRYGARDDNAAVEDLVGQRGQAATTMAPSGRIVIEGKSYEAYSQSGLLHKGAAVEVVGRDAFRVVVKKIS